MRFEFWRGTPIPLTLRILHTLQLIAVLPAFPLGLIVFFALIITNVKGGIMFLLPLPWLFSCFSIFLLLHFERVDARKRKMTERRYSRLQMLKLLWTIVFFMPLFIATIASPTMKLVLFVILTHPESFWKVIVWFNVVHW
jgi:hypothetical protein